MSELHACEATFLAHLDWMRQTMASLCRRHVMGHADADDFASWALLRILENDYGILRRFRGESALTTYLVVVIATLHREYRVRCWGRWRPSAAARRAGRVAMRLEALVHRDGHTVRQAALVLRTSGETDLSERELVELFVALPRRAAGRLVEIPVELVDVPSNDSAEATVSDEQRHDERQHIEAALVRALDTLPNEDRLVVRMRFWDGLTVADIARALDVPQKPLYRRLDRALIALRRSLEEAGLSRRQARSVLEQAA